MSIEQFLTKRDVAGALKISMRTVENLTRKGVLSAVRLGKMVRYNPARLEADMERFTVRGQTASGSTPRCVQANGQKKSTAEML